MENLRTKFEYVINDSNFFVLDYENKSDQELINDNVKETERVAKELEKIAIQSQIDLLKKFSNYTDFIHLDSNINYKISDLEHKLNLLNEK